MADYKGLTGLRQRIIECLRSLGGETTARS
jgi:hypothetical protein